MATHEISDTSGEDEDVTAGPDLFPGTIFLLQPGTRARPDPANLTIWPYGMANYRWSLRRHTGRDYADGGRISVGWNQHRPGALRRRALCAVDSSGWHAAARLQGLFAAGSERRKPVDRHGEGRVALEERTPHELSPTRGAHPCPSRRPRRICLDRSRTDSGRHGTSLPNLRRGLSLLCQSRWHSAFDGHARAARQPRESLDR